MTPGTPVAEAPSALRGPAAAGVTGDLARRAAPAAVAGALRELLLEVARVALTRPALADRLAGGADPERLVERDPLRLVALLNGSPRLRARLRAGGFTAGAVVDDPTADDPVAGPTNALASALLDEDRHGEAARRLQALLQPSGAALGGPHPADRGTRGKRAHRDRPDAHAKQLRYARQRETELQERVRQLTGKLSNALAERDAARDAVQRVAADRDDAAAVALAAREDADAAQAQAGDLLVAARLLLAAVEPPAPPEADDPRDREQAGLAGDATTMAPAAPRDVRVSAALAAADVPAAQFTAVLRALVTPPAPRPRVATARQREFVVTPLGGDEEIGGSCLLVEVGDTRVLVDAGMRPKAPLGDAGPPRIARALADRLDALVVTHAHTDHAGFVPAVLAAQPHVPVVTTSGTAALLSTMWADSVTVFGHQARADAQRGEPSVAPYTQEDWRAARRRVVELDYGRRFSLPGGVTLELFPAGHVLGACGVVITADGRRVTVTGDVSTSDQRQMSVGGLVVPESAVGSDLLVIESTYCRRPSTSRHNEVDRFLSVVRETVDSDGRVLVPAFALGRAQEVAMLLREHLGDVPVLVDGMAREVSQIYERHSAGTERPLHVFGENVQPVVGHRRDATIAQFRRGVVVTTSGMLAAGPAVPWARSVLPDPASALLIAGYQDEESPGAELLRLAAESSGRRELVLDGRPVDVAARVATFSLSAHADRHGLTSIIDEVAPHRVMLVHGNPGPQREYREVLRVRGHVPVPTAVWAGR